MRAVLFICVILLTNTSFAQIRNGEDAGCETCFTSLETALANKDSVICLNLSKKRLKEFPAEITEFKNLKVLILNKNRITTIPATISQLQNLEVLSVFRNKIEDMTPLTNLPNLIELDISDNYIEDIPDDIDKMKSLKRLHMGMNVIGYYPSSLGFLENLEFFDLTENEMNRAEQDYVRNLLPKTEIKFSYPCFCNFDEEE